MLVVADTSPFDYLVWIEAEHIQPPLYSKSSYPGRFVRSYSPQMRLPQFAVGRGISRLGLKFALPIQHCLMIVVGALSISAGEPRLRWPPFVNPRFF